MITEAPKNDEAVREEIVPKDIMSIMGCSRAKAYTRYKAYRDKLGLGENPLSIDQFCELTGFQRVRVIPHVRLRAAV